MKHCGLIFLLVEFPFRNRSEIFLGKINLTNKVHHGKLTFFLKETEQYEMPDRMGTNKKNLKGFCKSIL